jgi:hypothetical protein
MMPEMDQVGTLDLRTALRSHSCDVGGTGLSLICQLICQLFQIVGCTTLARSAGKAFNVGYSRKRLWLVLIAHTG